MTELQRLDKRVVALAHCSRREAQQYVEGGWVRVDGTVVEQPQFLVAGQTVQIDADATLAPLEAVTLVLHKPAGHAAADASALVTPQSRWDRDPSGVRPLHRHLMRLQMLLPMPPQASGLLLFSQDWRVVRRLTDDAARIEQEFVVEVAGELDADGLARLNRSDDSSPYTRAPMKVSWQSDHHLRFAFKRLQADAISTMCSAVGLRVLGMKRLRVGRIPLTQLPCGQWRYLAPDERI
ncbi:MAG: RNA pseudouridine synthase [Rhodanobacter sp.]